jgi:hypothetical protein
MKRLLLCINGGASLLSTPLVTSVTETRYISTGFSALDQAVGNIPSGCIVEIMGKLTSGATTLVHHITAQAQGDEHYGVYVDLEETFDPVYGAKRGIKPDRLYIVHPQTDIQALDIARDMLKSTGGGIMVLDLGRTLPNPGLLHRFTSTVADTGCIVVVLFLLATSSYPRNLFAGSPATLRLQLERKAALREYNNIIGYQSTVKILKSPIPIKRNPVDIAVYIEDVARGGSM